VGERTKTAKITRARPERRKKEEAGRVRRSSVKRPPKKKKIAPSSGTPKVLNEELEIKMRIYPRESSPSLEGNADLGNSKRKSRDE